MLKHPRFKPHLHLEIIKGEGLFVVSEFQQTVLQGRLYEIVAPWLDGRPVEELCAQLREQASPAEVFYTLTKLEQKGLLCESDESLPLEQACLWAIQGADPATAARRLTQGAVAVHGLGVDVGPLESLLRSLHVRVDKNADFLVVATDDYLRNELHAFNQKALQSGRPWLLVKPVGGRIWIGPLLHPGKTGCWACLVHRILSVNPLLGYLENLRGESIHPAMGLTRTPATLSLAWGLAANAATSWIVHGGDWQLLEGKILTFDLSTCATQWHTLIKHPPCPACGTGPTPVERPVGPVVLESRQKTCTDDGGYRSLPAQETLDKYGRHVSSICGAVRVLERSVFEPNDVVHVYFSGSNVARPMGKLAHVKIGLRNSTAGKGTSDVQARASALCEGLERYCGIFRGDEMRRPARMAELGEAAIHPNACMLFSERQYQGREAHNAQSSVFQYVPRPFDPRREVEWTPVWSLTREAVRYLPTAFCYYLYPCNDDSDFCMSCSNGNAAGNCLEEAILQGVLELVERDSVSLWWYNRIRRPGVDLESFEEPYLQRLKAYLKTRGRELWALDLTSDVGIPAFAACSRFVDGPEEHVMFGFGAHLDARIGLLRAVTELNQMLSSLLQTPQDQIPASLSDRETVDWLRTARLAHHPYLVPAQGPLRRRSSYPECATSDLKEDILICKARVEALGLEMLVLDQTRPEIGMPVVKVIVPGLRHFWARFAPGRLYDVPARLGWLEKPLAEEELNPVAMFL